MNYTVDLLKYKDVDKSLNLVNRVFDISMSIDVWKWYIFNNPYGASRVYLLYQGNKLIGLHGWSPSIIKIKNKKYKSAYGHSLAIMKECRNTTSYIKLMKHSFDQEQAQNTNILIGHPNQNAYVSHKALMRMQDFCRLDIYKKERIKSVKHGCEEIFSFDDRFNKYLNKISSSYDFCFLQSIERLNWRYFGHPNKPYTVFIDHNNREVTGHIILNKRVDVLGNKVVHIMDIHAFENDTFNNLIFAAESYARDCMHIDIWCVNGFPFIGTLENIGFRKVSSRPVVIKTFNGCEIGYQIGKSSYMYGDADKIY